MSELRAAVLEAREALLAETGLDQEALFGEHILQASEMTARAAHAVGVIEGAAIALGLTALELLDEIDAVDAQNGRHRHREAGSNDS